MCVVSYYKLGGQWFLDLPDYLQQGCGSDLERIGSFHDFLQFTAAGKPNVSFEFGLHPFEGADELVLLGSSGEQTGGYYHLHSFQGTVLDLELWFNNVLYYFINNTTLPPYLYIKLLG
jgi:hypothetical protein